MVKRIWPDPKRFRYLAMGVISGMIVGDQACTIRVWRRVFKLMRVTVRNCVTQVEPRRCHRQCQPGKCAN
ncbi:MAG TPA: hypothetical protein VM939_02575 [Gemmatimonadaceae bacterium]|nr:hypothetical protein [Gemmatimonadaceae bacterium]